MLAPTIRNKNASLNTSCLQSQDFNQEFAAPINKDQIILGKKIWYDFKAYTRTGWVKSPCIGIYTYIYARTLTHSIFIIKYYRDFQFLITCINHYKIQIRHFFWCKEMYLSMCTLSDNIYVLSANCTGDDLYPCKI